MTKPIPIVQIGKKHFIMEVIGKDGIQVGEWDADAVEEIPYYELHERRTC